MAWPCLVALIIVLIIVILVVRILWNFYKIIRKWDIQIGNLPRDKIINNINYTSYLPTQLPDPAVFDKILAGFLIQTCESSVNRRLGGSTQLPHGVIEVGWIEGHALILKLTYTKNIYIVAIAGTLTYEDVRIDIDYQLVDFYGAHTHSGFTSVWKKIYPSILNITKSNPNAEFIITGHSLGASVATLIATSLGLDYSSTKVALYASATPRTGSLDFIKLLKKAVPNHWHITNRADIIPTLPPSVSLITSGPNKGKKVLYADYDRVVYFDAQSGTLEYNHLSGAYLCALVGGKICSQDLWTVSPQIIKFTI